jgi:hypothetical protein
LQERGVDAGCFDQAEQSPADSQAQALKTTGKSFNGELLHVWLVTLFAFGMSQNVHGSFSKVAGQIAVEKFVIALVCLVIGGAVAAYFIRRKTSNTRSIN